ncbi:ATP-grasp domain-containing protein [Lutibacter sp.]|uniref:ATP-grasp domain-containing protein n=1 Tax=Lutibacter sp. TaxID=1925666 RepID=UPI0025B89675|nr:ATP-grasp domain-containing protein [Lutibacter sp.]MCF6169145.1 ATP-grasp domain-containing protein [Lutibacter sp.]
MILIDKPYVSDFLIETIKKNNFKIVATSEAKKMILDKSLNWISEREAITLIKNNPTTPVYSNSENIISWVEQNLEFSKLPTQIQLFKNKITFRELIQDIFPNYFFKGVKFEDLDSVSINNLPFPFIIKPAIGFFSLGVHKVDKPQEWKQVLTEIKQEINQIKGFYPSEVLNTTNFIIEECIEGEEYAVDCYFNKNGAPIVLNILHHIFSSGKDVSDRIYTTSKEIIESNIEGIEKFLQIIGKKASLINFPVHVEVRIDKQGKIIPIEINPLRFGGWCTTGDLSWYAYGINSYEYFIKDKKPNWKEILETRKDKKYSIILLDNSADIDINNIAYFNYEEVLKDFENPLSLRKVDFNEYPIFGILFVETSLGNEQELANILTSKLEKYIVLK